MPKKSTLRTRTLNIGLLRKGTSALKALDDALDDWPAHEIHVGGAKIGTLHLAPSKENPPVWRDLFDEADINPAKNRSQQHESAVFTISQGGRTYVLPFGHGRHKIPDHVLEPRFGRLVTLNALDPNAVRVVDNLKLDGTSRNSRTQVAQPASLVAFDLQPSAEIVKSLGGRAQASSFAKRISGSTFAQVTAPMALSKLVDQDPNDEPAEKLLARIRAERAAAPGAKKGRGRKAKAAP